MSAQRHQLDLRDCVTILLRRKWWVAFSLLAVSGGTLLYTLTIEPTYTATARVLIRIDFTPPEERMQVLGAPLLEALNVETQLEILRSPELLEQARERAAAIARAGRFIGFRVEQIKKTNLVLISATATSAARAAAVANSLGEVYIERSLHLNKRAVEQALQYVNEQVLLAGRELDQAEVALRDYREQTGIIEAEAATAGQLGRVGSLQQEYDKLSVESQAIEAEVRQVDRQRRETRRTIVSERHQGLNPVVEALDDKLLALEMQRLQLLDEYVRGSRKIRQVDEQIAALKQRLDQEVDRVVTRQVETGNPLMEQLDQQRVTLEAQRIATVARQAALAGALPAENAHLSALPARLVEFNRLTRRVKVAENSYMNLLTNQQHLLLARGSEVPDAALVSAAALPREPVRPRLLLAILLGLLLGLTLAVLIDYVDDTIKDPREAEGLLGLPVVGLIGHVDSASLPTEDPVGRSPLTEAFRALRSNLRFSAVDQPLKTILVTSAAAGEGKSTIAANLAVAAASAGQRVILVDADLRRPSLHRLFECDNDVGLTSVLVGDVPLDQALVNLESKRLSLLTSGPVPPNPIELLESEGFGRMMQSLAERADLVVLDSPPLLVVADGQILSSRTDGTVLVLEMQRTKREMATQAKELLSRANARLLGLVANKLRRGPAGYYYYYYHDYTWRKAKDVGRDSGRRGGSDGCDGEPVFVPPMAPGPLSELAGQTVDKASTKSSLSVQSWARDRQQVYQDELVRVFRL